uniref:Phospholipid-transporting ATPase n=1 Tax=Callorhinchus milii TaxID=7868 RepID=A0A4W3JYT3_CALMI
NFCNNRINTSKYNVITFLPINLFEQFQRVANAYFLFLLILQLIPHISSLSWFTTIVPLVLVLTITAVKDATDDFFRYKSDNQVNNRNSQVLIGGKLQNKKWMNVRVGDIIKLENNQFVAADLMLLSSSEPHGLSYVETAELDGETNLKVRQALTVTSELGSDISRLAEFDGEVICEPPNNKLDRFTGTLSWKDNKYSLDNEKVLLRGCVLRNTEWCFGMVIFAGPDTKLMQNCGHTKFKRTSIDRLMNTLVLWIFGFLVCMGTILAIGNSIWEHKVGFYFQIYLPWDPWIENSVFSGFLSFWSYIIILNTVVPISLYVSVEVIRLGHSYFINWDRKMYYAKKDTFAEARTTTLNEELGQIEYIFSDKTGTLTQNIMVFNKCSINGKAYGDVYDEHGHKTEISERIASVDFSSNPLADKKFMFYDHSLLEAVKLEVPMVHEFFRVLSLCHTVMPEEKNEGELFYQAQSPDEGALVMAARNFGFVFRFRTPETITVQEMGKSVTYQLLAILDFNNVRKRMSVIVRNPDGQIRLYTKGADTILFERLHPSNEELMCVTSDHLSEFAGEGLRTLVLAYKDLDEDYFEEWLKMHHHASVSLDNRDEKLAAVYEEIEQDMMLLGATAIEDKLQEGVPDTIANLSLANIKIWVLTGDKQETAVNIGYSCNMLRDDMNEIFTVSGHTALEVREELRQAKERMTGSREGLCNGHHSEKAEASKFESVIEETVTGDYALIMNGHSLAHALEADLDQEFLETASMCRAVICCRVTPLQKAQVVELVKMYRKAVTLAIGDGANDVSMIKTAHIGVGISGQEGMQAVLASDYSIAQFRYLQRLLLVHGRWSYLRMCKFLCYFFYKNFAFTLVHFWFGFFCGFSAQIGLDTSYWTAINHFFIWGSVAIYFCILFAMHSNGLFELFQNQFPFVGNARNSLIQFSVWLIIMLTTVVCIMPVVAFRFLVVDLKPTLSDKVRYMQRARRKQRPRLHRMRKVHRNSSRRSGYAFAHQEGYGELITSGKNMRFSNPSAPGLQGRSVLNSASWIETLRKKTTETVNSFGSDRHLKA